MLLGICDISNPLYPSFLFEMSRNLKVIRDQDLFLPAGVVAEWKDNPHCGESFRQWLDQFPYKVIDAAQMQEPQQSSGGGGGNNNEPQPSPKRARTDNAPEVDSSLIVSEAPQALIQEVKLGNGMPVIHLRSEKSVYLWNGTDKNFVQTDFCLAFFGSGSYKILKANQEVPDKGVLLDFKDSSDQIVLNGVVQTISEAVTAMRIKKTGLQTLLSPDRGWWVGAGVHLEANPQSRVCPQRGGAASACKAQSCSTDSLQ